MDETSVRPLEPSDVAALAPLVRSALAGEVVPEPLPPALGAMLAQARLSPYHRALVAERRGQPVGLLVLAARPALSPTGARAVVDLLAADADAEPALLAAAAVQAEMLGVDLAHPRLPQPAAAPPGPHAGFLVAAARAATAAAAAIGGCPADDGMTRKADGSPSLPADRAAETAAVPYFRALGLPLVSEERVRDAAVGDGSPDVWVALDPIDGTRNYRDGLTPYAFSAGLVEDGVPVAGLVADLSSGRRWWGSVGDGAWLDGRPLRPTSGRTVVVPSPSTGWPAYVPPGAARLRISGCTSIDLCRVADGSASAWHNLDRSGTYTHDVAGGLAVLRAAGGAVLAEDGGPLVLPRDTEVKIRFVAGANADTAEQLRSELIRAWRDAERSR